MKLKMSKMFLCTMLSIAFLCSAILFGVYSISNARVSTSGSIIYSVPVATTVSSATSQVSGTLSLPSATASAINNLTIKGNSVQYNILPSEYQEVEYIQSSGTQYINTGLTLSTSLETKYETELQFNSINTSARQLMGANAGGYFGISKTGYYEIGESNLSSVMASTTSFDKIIFEQDFINNLKILTVNGVTNNRSYSTWTDTEIYLFDLGGVAAGTYDCNVKMKSFKIYQDDKLLRDYIPCYRISDNVIGLYDTVNKEFHTNAGTGEFKTGVSVLRTDGFQQVEYIQSSGTQYIDTKFTPNQDTRVLMDFQMVDISDGCFLFGSRTSTNAGDAYTFNLGTVNNKFGFVTNYGSKTSNEMVKTPADKDRHIVDKDKNITKLDESITITSNAKTFNSPATLRLFASYSKPTAAYLPCKTKVYSCKIYDNGTLVRDYVPCYKTSDSTIGLYDLVNNVFYENKGTETFSKGSDVNVPSPDNPQEIQSVGERTKNLFNANAIKNTNIKVSNNGATITMPIIEGSNNNGYTGTGTKLIEACPDLKVGDKVVVSFTRNSNKNGLIYLSGSNYQWNRNTAKVITEEDLNSTLVLYANRASEGETGVQIVISDMQIEKGSTATAYEPYGYKVPVNLNGTTHNIYLDEPLRAIGNVADELTISENGTITVTRKVAYEYITVVDGVSGAEGTYKKFLSAITYKPLVSGSDTTTKGVAISNKFKTSSYSYAQLSSYANYIQPYITGAKVNKIVYTFDDSSITTKELAQEKIGNGFEVCYLLATEQTTTLSQTLVLNTVKGDNTLSITTGVTPADISVVYMKKG